MRPTRATMWAYVSLHTQSHTHTHGHSFIHRHTHTHPQELLQDKQFENDLSQLKLQNAGKSDERPRTKSSSSKRKQNNEAEIGEGERREIKKTLCEIFRDSNCKSCAAVIAAKFRRATQRERIRDNNSRGASSSSNCCGSCWGRDCDCGRGSSEGKN